VLRGLLGLGPPQGPGRRVAYERPEGRPRPTAQSIVWVNQCASASPAGRASKRMGRKTMGRAKPSLKPLSAEMVSGSGNLLSPVG
jgi:hypothetical protein